jgi:hypothetical protein
MTEKKEEKKEEQKKKDEDPKEGPIENLVRSTFMISKPTKKEPGFIRSWGLGGWGI